MLRIIIVAAAVLAVWGSGAQAEPPKAGPHLSASEIRALRPTMADVWRLTYRLQEENGQAQLISFTLAPDYVAVEDEHGLRLFDFRLARVLDLPRGNGFSNHSLASLVLFRIHELTNRRSLGAVMAGVKLDAKIPTFDTFLTESALSMTDAKGPVLPLEFRQMDGQLSWWRNGEMVTEFAPGPEAPEAVKANLIRLWRHGWMLHPVIAQSIAETGRAPASLSVLADGGSKVIRRSLILDRAERVDAADYPLPSQVQLAQSSSSSAGTELVELARQAVRSGARPPNAEEYVRLTQASLARGQGLEALLWAMESMLVSGVPDCKGADATGERCTGMRRVWPAGMADPRAAAIFG